MWVKFQPGFAEAVERIIRLKMTNLGKKCSVCNGSIQRSKGLKEKNILLYLRARKFKFKDPDIKIHYKQFRAHVQKVLRDTYWKYVTKLYLRLIMTAQIPTLLIEHINVFSCIWFKVQTAFP